MSRYTTVLDGDDTQLTIDTGELRKHEKKASRAEQRGIAPAPAPCCLTPNKASCRTTVAKCHGVDVKKQAMQGMEAPQGPRKLNRTCSMVWVRVSLVGVLAAALSDRQRCYK